MNPRSMLQASYLPTTLPQVFIFNIHFNNIFSNFAKINFFPVTVSFKWPILMSNMCFQLTTETMLFLYGKDKVVPVHSMKAYMVSGGIAPRILNLSIIWRSQGDKIFLPIYLRRKSSVTQGRGGQVDPKSSPDIVEKKKNSISLAGI